MTETSARTPSTAPYLAEVEDMLRRAGELVAAGRPMPLSASVMINRDEVLELIEGSLERLPDELKAARWLLKERGEYLADARRHTLPAAKTVPHRVAVADHSSRCSEITAQRTGHSPADSPCDRPLSDVRSEDHESRSRADLRCDVRSTGVSSANRTGVETAGCATDEIGARDRAQHIPGGSCDECPGQHRRDSTPPRPPHGITRLEAPPALLD